MFWLFHGWLDVSGCAASSVAALSIHPTQLAKCVPMASPETEHTKEKPQETFFGSYEAHAKTLRGWLILYGAGLPAYFLKEQTFAGLLKQSGNGQLIIGLFLGGILLQVAQVFLYKISMGYLYLGELDEEFTKTKRHKVSSWYSNLTWPVVISDLGTIVVYGWASWMLLVAFLQAPLPPSSTCSAPVQTHTAPAKDPAQTAPIKTASEPGTKPAQ